MKKNRVWIFAVTAIVLLILDQVVKAWVRGHVLPHQTFWAWGNIFEITLTYNEGIAFGLFQGAGALLAPIAVAIAGAAGWYSVKHPNESVVSHVAMGLLVAGALGNLYDRMVQHRVTDMFYFRLINFPVFNIADACITIATILLMLTWWADAHKKQSEAAQVARPIVETPGEEA